MTISLSTKKNKYSSFVKLQTITAFCLRFVHNVNTKDTFVGPLNVDELNSANKIMVRMLQDQHFNKEKVSLQNGDAVYRKIKLRLFHHCSINQYTNLIIVEL